MKLSEKAMKIKASSTLALTAMSKKLREEGVDLASFTAGEPDFDTPDNIKQAAINAINSGFTKYTPAEGTVELRKAITENLKKHGLNYDFTQIVVSNGGKHSLTNVFLSALNEGDEVIIPAPFWLSYPEMVKVAGGVPVIVQTKKENGYKITGAELYTAYTNKTKAIVINSPSNPVGNVYTEDELRVIADFAVEMDILVISDEIYGEIIYNGTPHVSIASLGDDIYERTVVCSGLSKTYAMTGWRIGYTASSKELAGIMSNLQSHLTSNANSIAQKAALEALTGSQDFVEKMRVEFKKRRDYICGRIGNIPLIDCLTPEGAFYIFVDVSRLLDVTIDGRDIDSSADLSECLLEKAQVVVVPCEDFSAPHHLRLSYATSMEEITKGMDRIEEFIKTYYKK